MKLMDSWSKVVRTNVGSAAGAWSLCNLVVGSMLSVAAVAADENARALPTIRVEDNAPGEATRSASGTKTDTPILEVPQAISVITREEMDIRGASTLREALSYTPGVQVEQSVDLRDEWFQLRGFGGTQNVFRDGLRVGLSSGYANADLNLYGLERVEVLRGPASVLYGQAGPGGIVNLVTKRPSYEPLHEVVLSGGSFSLKEAAFDSSAPLDERWSYRLTGVVRDSDTQTDFVENDRIYVAPALSWQPADQTSLTLLAHYQNDSQGAAVNNSLPRVGTLSPNSTGRIAIDRYPGEPAFDEFEKSQSSLGYLFSHGLSETWTLNQNLRYSRVESDYANAYADELAPDERTVGRSVYTPSDEATAWTLDNRAQAKWTHGAFEHAAIFGVDYRRTRYAFEAGFDDAPSLDIYAPSYGAVVATPALYEDSVARASQVGAYLQDQVTLQQRWVFLLGGRWDRAKTDKRDAISGSRTEQKDSKFTGRAGMVYLAGNGLAPYASYSTSFEPVIGEDAAGRTFDPTGGKQAEVGLRYQPPGSRGLFAAAIFDLTQKNVLTTDLGDPNFRIQTGEIRSRGVELEGKFAITPALNVTAAYTYTDAQIRQSNDGVEGNRRGGVPRSVAALWADYTIESGALQGLTGGVGARFTGKSPVADTNVYNLSTRTLMDALVRYDWDRLELSLHASNLLNKEYVGFCANDDYGFCGYGPARNVVLSARYRW